VTNSFKFDNLSRIPDEKFAPWAKKNRIEVPPEVVVPENANISQGLEALYNGSAQPEFLFALSYALPARQGVWFACMAARDMLEKDAEPTPAIKAAEAWVFKPNVASREATFKIINNADPDDLTVVAAESAFHGITKGLEDEVLSPPAASPAMVFSAALQSLLVDEDPDVTEKKWTLLVARGLNIASGGNGKIE